MIPAACHDPIAVLVVGPADDIGPLLPDKIRCVLDRAPDPGSALGRLASKLYDVIIVDHTAEGDVTEEQLAYMRAILAIRPEAKVILLVAHNTTRKVLEALQHGMFAYFSRPFEPGAVRDAIIQAISTQSSSDGIEVISLDADFITVRLRCRMYTANRLANFMNELPCNLSNDDRIELAVAFREMLLNAIEHGGKLDPNEWVHASRVRTRRTIVYRIQDPGEGFCRTDLKHAAICNPEGDPTAHMQVRAAEDMRPGGFGLLITTRLVDEVIYNQKGNEVILIKHLD